MKTSKVLKSIGNGGLFVGQKSCISVAYAARGIINMVQHVEDLGGAGATVCLAKRKGISNEDAAAIIVSDFNATLKSMDDKTDAILAKFKRTPKVEAVCAPGIR